MSKLTKGRAPDSYTFRSLDSPFCLWWKICNTVKFSWEDRHIFFSKIRVWRNLTVTEIHGSPCKYDVFVTVTSSMKKNNNDYSCLWFPECASHKTLIMLLF